MPIEFAPHPKQLTGLDFVVCHRVKSVPLPSQEAEKLPCSKCGEQVWRALNSPQKPPVICIECVNALATKDDNMTMFVGPKIADALMRGTSHPDLDHLIDLALKSKSKP